MTKPTYKELEEKLRYEKYENLKIKSELTSLIIFSIGITITLFVLAFYAGDLNSQLEECKNPQEVWTLKYECDWGETQYTASYNVTSYEKYLKQVEFMKQLTSCEEIK